MKGSPCKNNEGMKNKTNSKNISLCSMTLEENKGVFSHKKVKLVF
jgi:hypothetical protein